MASDTPKPRGPDEPLFLGREHYRFRRVIDAARLMPALGILLFAIPLLWPVGATGTASAMIYIFSVWFAVALFTAIVSRRLSRRLKDPQYLQELRR